MTRLQASGFVLKLTFLGTFYLLCCLVLLIIALPVMSATFDWTQATRWREDAPSNTGVRKKYPEILFPYKTYDVRPHEQLYYMYPFSLVGDGNNKQSSDNLWKEVVNSGYVIGNSSSLVRAKDMMEDFHINFINPLNFTRNYYFHFYVDRPTSYVNRISFPLTLSNGPNAGQNLLFNDRLLAVGDDNTLWLDTDGSLSIYNYPNGTLEFNSTKTTFTTGPASWIGTTVVSKLQYMIGYEEGKIYFLEGDNTLHVFNYDLVYQRTDDFLLDGNLHGYNLSDLVDGNIPGALYLGWDLGPVVAFVDPDYGGNPPVAENTYTWTQTSRWLEEGRVNGGPIIYQQEISGYWDSRPHQQLRTMYPGDIVGDGNNKETSDNLWASILTSDNLIGNSTTLTRARDAMEDFHYNFIDPAVADRSYYFYFYHDNDSLWLHRTSFPLTLGNGPNVGQSLLNNDRLLAMGDDNSLWLDNDGTLSYYNYPGGLLEFDSTKTVFPRGPRGWIGVPVVEKIPQLIGYEQAYLYFLEGDSTVHVFNYDLSYIRTDVVELDGDLTGHTLAEVIDHEVPGVTYGGWDLGPVFIMVDTSTPPMQLDHFELDYSSVALTCNPQPVVIKACADASCSSLFTDPVTVTLTPAGWVGGNVVSFSGGSTARALAVTTPSTVAPGVSLSVPAVSGGAVQCSVDGGAASTACSLTFADTGFVVNTNDFPSSRGTSVSIKTVRKDDVSQQCVPAFSSVTKPLAIWTDYVDPDAVARVASYAATVNGVSVGTDSGAPVSVNLAFDAQGETIVALNYADAGQLRLNLLYAGAGADAGLVMTGSDLFVAYPMGLCVTTSTSCPAGDATCPVFARAGENFDLTVTAMAWQMDGDTDFCDGNSPTPSYAASSVALSGSIVAPSPANQSGVVTPANYDHSASASGAFTLQAQESEVGVFRFGVTPPTYFGYTLGTFQTEPTGRFIPDHFIATAISDGEIEPFCNLSTPFSYTGADMNWLVAPELEITAVNSSGSVTQNYTQGGFMKLTAADVVVAAAAADLAAVGTDSNPLAISADLQEGTLNVNAPGTFRYLLSALDTIRVNRTAQAEIAPFTPITQVGLTEVTDGDGVQLNLPVTMTPVTPFSMRYGRMWAEDVYGPETSDLPVPLRTEYFDGSRYRLNEDDYCSIWNNNNATLGATGLTEIVAGNGILSAGRSSPSGVLLRAPVNVVGTPDTGTENVTYDAPDWLEGDYDSNGTNEDPQAEARFGIYRGHERIIMWRERY